jgi:hypothetical protein
MTGTALRLGRDMSGMAEEDEVRQSDDAMRGKRALGSRSMADEALRRLRKSRAFRLLHSRVASPALQLERGVPFVRKRLRLARIHR